jgi:pimeloyl-ACP methyl ester carboxylesterase
VRTPLILVPGLLGDAAVWAAQRAALSERADVLIADHAPVDSLGALAESIIAQAPARFAIAGHSMGGRIALEVARRTPQRLSGLAILDTGCDPLAPGTAGERETATRHALLAIARQEGMRAMARTWVQGMIHPQRLADRELVEGILDMFERRTPELFALQIHALLTRPEARSVLAGLACPTLVLCGQEDSWAPPARHRAMAARVRNGILSIVPECGHMSPLERPLAVNEALLGWLDVLEAAA